MKKTIWKKRVLALPLALLLLLGSYAAYVLIDYYRLADLLPLTVEGAQNASAGEIARGTTYRAVSSNVGFGAYSADFSFFMDGGKESRARSKEEASNNIAGCAAAVFAADPDFILFQEVDIGSTRNCGLDQAAQLHAIAAEEDGALCSVFAQNYDSPYLFYPFTEPHGASYSGLLTYSRHPITSALRRSLPIEEGFMKFLDLDRCYSVHRMAAEGGREFVLYNLHLSAYTSDGTIATEQLALLCADMLAEYEKGNYCLAGGDFNKDLLGDSGKIFGIPKREQDTWAQPIPAGTIPEGIRLIAPVGAASCRVCDAAYNEETSFRLTVDGFLISDNIELVSSTVIDTGFAYSDHNPVLIDFKLK